MNIHVNLPFLHTEENLRNAVEAQVGEGIPFRILKKSVDARHRRDIRVQYSVTTDTMDPVEAIRQAIWVQMSRVKEAGLHLQLSPVVVGSGPGGIFCAHWLNLHGCSVTMLEQGPPMRERIRDMARFMKHGDLHPWSNICFGAGGAGTYSDGKLITRIRSPFIPFVMQQFVQYGAPDSIRYLYNPHLGSNKIRQCITRMLDEMEGAGVQVRYNTRFTDFLSAPDGSIHSVMTADGDCIAANALFLATGHSARDVYSQLRLRNVEMSAKDFAMGVRVEHPAVAINEIQYGADYSARYPGIETAQYKLALTWKDEARAVYSFCMCPGGYILNASTSTDGIVTNGMSNYQKSGRFSNAAIVVNVSADDLVRLGYGGIDGGLGLQRDLEEVFRSSVNVAGRCNVIPGQRLSDFLDGRSSTSLLGSSSVNPIAAAPLHRLFPDFISTGLERGFRSFDNKLRGFAQHPKAQLFGIESRTSSPCRIERDPVLLTSPTHGNLYPVGEGAGYAGGITSAAIDGIRTAQAWLGRFIELDPLLSISRRKDVDLSDEDA
jgi:uncharacterized protein